MIFYIYGEQFIKYMSLIGEIDSLFTSIFLRITCKAWREQFEWQQHQQMCPKLDFH